MRPKDTYPPFPALAGNRYGSLTVVESVLTDIGVERRWLCLCDCGTQKIVLQRTLTNTAIKSCGCQRVKSIVRAVTKHGSSRKNNRTSEYNIWLGLRDRCHNDKTLVWKYYGGRGISVCARWDEFESFLADMGPRPSKGHSIDRIDVNGDYEPGNCRWATKTEQARNTRRSRRIMRSDGVVYRALAEAAETNKISVCGIRHCCQGRQKSYAGYVWSYAEDFK